MREEYVGLTNRPFRLTMGLRPLEHDRWFEDDEHAAAQRNEKRHLLASAYDDVVAVLPEGASAAEELSEMVASFRDVSLPPARPLEAASLLVPDDLCVLTVRGDTWHLAASSLCFPSRWDPALKIGASLDEIHGPVPGYDAELAAPVRALFNRMTPDRSFWRLNWTLLDDPSLRQIAVRRRPHAPNVDDWWFRVERQTLRMLPRTRAVVFTIRTYVTSLPELLSGDRRRASDLLLALRTAPPATLDYKGWVGLAEVLEPALAGRSED